MMRRLDNKGTEAPTAVAAITTVAAAAATVLFSARKVVSGSATSVGETDCVESRKEGEAQQSERSETRRPAGSFMSGSMVEMGSDLVSSFTTCAVYLSSAEEFTVGLLTCSYPDSDVFSIRFIRRKGDSESTESLEQCRVPFTRRRVDSD